MSEYSDNAKKFPGLFESMKADVDEFIKKGTMSRASKLAKLAKCHFNASEAPLYFTGDLNAKLVLVHLNPKHDNNSEEYRKKEPPFMDIESYYDRYRNFGSVMHLKTRTHKSPFDKKQLRFLKQFGGIKFVPEINEDARRKNLARSIDRKLQLELVPYSSNNFETSKFDQQMLADHKKRLLDVITAEKRKFVLFCGAVFDEIFGSDIIETFQEHLPLKKGGFSKSRAKFSRLRIEHNGQIISAGLAHTYPRKGLNMEEYAKMCEKYY